MKETIRSLIRGLGFDIIRWHPEPLLPPDFEPRDREIALRVQPYTMTPPERIYALIRAVEHVCRRGIPGAIVECGVWKGGSMMAAALTLLKEGEIRELYLYDTFEGMTTPTSKDVDASGRSAASWLARSERRPNEQDVWAYAPLKAVRAAMQTTGYDAQHVHFVHGPVERTIPATVPGSIAILRLDTDWYESTKHELEHLYPLLSPGGILIVDDYGHWAGARQATDEFIAGLPIFLCRTDYAGRIAVKPSSA